HGDGVGDREALVQGQGHTNATFSESLVGCRASSRPSATEAGSMRWVMISSAARLPDWMSSMAWRNDAWPGSCWALCEHSSVGFLRNSVFTGNGTGPRLDGV